MKEKHTLDELFREKLAGHTSQVPDHLWSGIVNKRGMHRAKGFFGSGLFWLLVSGGLMVGAGAYLSESFIAQNNNNVVNMASLSLSESNTENDQTRANENSFNETNTNSPETLNSESTISDQNDESADLEGSNSDPSSENRSGDTEINKTQGQNGGADGSQPSATKAVPAGIVSSTSAGGDPFVSANTSSNSGAAGASNKAGASGGSEGLIKSSSNGGFALRTNMSTASVGDGLKTTSEPSLLKIRPTDLNGAPILSDPDLSLTPPPAVHGPKKSRWYVDASAGYYTLDQKWENENSEGKDQRVGAETFNNAVDLGLRTGIQTKNGLTLSLGVLYSKASSTVSTTSSSTDTIVTTSLDSVGFYQDTLNNVLVTIWDTVSTISLEENNKTLRASNSYSLIQIPVSVGYSVQKGRFELGVNVGASFDLLVSSSASYPVIVSGDTLVGLFDEDLIQELISGTSSIRSGLSLFGNLSIAYMFSEKLHLLIEPTIRSSTIPFDSSGPPYVKLNYYGVRAGLRYFF